MFPLLIQEIISSHIIGKKMATAFLSRKVPAVSSQIPVPKLSFLKHVFILYNLKDAKLPASRFNSSAVGNEPFRITIR